MGLTSKIEISENEEEIENYGSSYAFNPNFDRSNTDTFDLPQHQTFSFPSTLIHYISINPKSAKGFSKIQKTCKYFFAKNKIIVVKNGVTAEGDFLTCYGISFELLDGFKYWLTNSINGYGDGNIMKYIYRCTFNTFLYRNQDFTLNEFNLLLGDGKIRQIELSNVNIYDSNGALVTIDKILEKVPFVKEFKYECENEIFNTKTFENLCSLKFNSKLQEIKLGISKISNEADFSFLCKFFQNNAANTFAFRISFYTAENKSKYLKDMKKEILTWINKDKLSVLIHNESIDIYKGKRFGHFL